MHYKAIKLVNTFIAIFGIILMVNAGRGITGFSISGPDAYISLTIGTWLFFVSILIYLAILTGEHRHRKLIPFKPRKRIGLREISDKAEERFVQIHARKPTKPELKAFIERDEKYGVVQV